MQTIINICLRKNKSKQSCVWIDSIFEAQNICFGSEIASLLGHSYDKCALDFMAENFYSRFYKVTERIEGAILEKS